VKADTREVESIEGVSARKNGCASGMQRTIGLGRRLRHSGGAVEVSSARRLGEDTRT
jgi:hypothetical protein